MRGNHSNVAMMESERIGDCAILVAECFAIREVILKASQKDIQRTIIQSDSQLAVNSTNGKINVPMFHTLIPLPILFS